MTDDNKSQPAGLTQQQLNIMAAMIEQAVTRAIARNGTNGTTGTTGPAGPPGPPGPPGPGGQPATADTSWKMEHIGCFDPDDEASKQSTASTITPTFLAGLII